MTYQQRLRDLRTERGLSQEAVAQVLNTTQQYYGKYELGKRPLPVDHLITLCRFYEVSADWLLGLKEKNT
ncbi:MAG: helix-turn-helix transcriptional regulator [Oscillospiraceae bacterium]|nr:helix-turn-helix transcriptional regulator [Oscillospiraceae bacterium]